VLLFGTTEAPCHMRQAYSSSFKIDFWPYYLI
jgi:hypothetical protein